MNTVKVYSPATIGNIGPGFDILGLASLRMIEGAVRHILQRLEELEK